MALQDLLDKIDTVVENKNSIAKLEEQQEENLIQVYSEQIKHRADKITEMITVVNKLADVKIAKSQYVHQLLHDFCELVEKNNLSIRFRSCGKYEYDSPYDFIALVHREKTDNFLLKVMPSGSFEYVERFYSGSERQAKVTSKVLLKFINEFDKTENLLNEFVTNL